MVAVLSLTAIPANAAVTAGELDPTFGKDGVVARPFGGKFREASGVAIQPDGKIVVVGEADGRDFGVARFNSDGSVDDAFGDGGLLAIDILGKRDKAVGVILRGDDILVGGQAEDRHGVSFAAVRLKSDGTIDASYGENGKALRGSFARASAMTGQGDKVVLLGSVDRNLDAEPVLVRFTADGAEDQSFYNASSAVYGLLEPGPPIEVATHGDGIVLPVRDRQLGGAVELLANDGRYDKFLPSPKLEEWQPIVFLPQGDKLLVAGTDDDDKGIGMARYQADGTLDMGFGDHGKIHLQGRAFPAELVAQGDKVVMVGSDFDELFAARFLRDGTLDTSFGQNGSLVTKIGGRGWGAAVQPDGKVVAIARGARDSFTMARLLP